MTSEDAINLLKLTFAGRNTVRVHQESNPDLPIHNQAHYLYATAVGVSIRERQADYNIWK